MTEEDAVDASPQSLGLRVAHVGVNCEDADEADQVAGLFCSLLSLELTHTPVSAKAGEAVEVMCGDGRGKCGHIAIHANSIEAAEPWFAKHGFTPLEGTRRRNADGSTFLVYLEPDVAGFALHLTLEG